jgi:lipopolysaccharide/colanic/teichoic acid biosynthesis glycosyltransferase
VKLVLPALEDRSSERNLRFRADAVADSVDWLTASTSVAATRAADAHGEFSFHSGRVKRTVDVIVAVTVLLFTFPLMLIIALAIVAESPGPVFYGAERVSRGGRRMRMLKFRKMHRDATGPKLTTRDDERLTRVGTILARTKLDELPQLINVLRGEMSLVGPRPEDPVFVAARPHDYEAILKVRPGLTGLSQVAFAAESRIISRLDPVRDYLDRIFPQKCALDRLYLRDAGLGDDVRILAWTVVAVLLRRPVAVDRNTGRMRLRRRSHKSRGAPLAGHRARWPSGV